MTRCSLAMSTAVAIGAWLAAASATWGQEDAKRIADLIEQLNTRDKLALQAATRGLGQIGPSALPALGEAVKKRPALTANVAAALTEMGADAIPKLLDVVRQDKHERLRQAVARGLGGMGPPAAAALVEAAADDDRYVRLTVLEALDAMTAQADLPVPEKVVPTLIGALSDKSYLIRLSMARSLGRLGPKNETVVPALLGVLKDDLDGRVRREVARGLMSIIRRGHCEEAMVAGLIAAATKDDDQFTRSAAATALGFVDKQRDEAAAALAGGLKDRFGVVRQASAQGLLQLGAGAKSAIEALSEALRSDAYPKVQWYAAGALGAIGADAAGATPALVQALKHKDGSVRATAAHALGQIGPGAVKAAPALLAVLEDASPLLRETAARSLGRIKAPAEEIVPALTKLLEDKVPRVRAAAKEALKEVGAKIEKKAQPKKALPKKAQPKKALPKKALPKKALPKKALPKKSDRASDDAT